MASKNTLINCGERTIQKTGRISIKDILKKYVIKEGEKVEVFLKKVEKQ
jgi:hypothetical protein